MCRMASVGSWFIIVYILLFEAIFARYFTKYLGLWRSYLVGVRYKTMDILTDPNSSPISQTTGG